MTITIPADAKRAAAKDKRIVNIIVYPDGWVPNSYKWRAPGRSASFRRNGCGHWKIAGTATIDRKRSSGSGPEWVAMSDKNGRLASA